MEAVSKRWYLRTCPHGVKIQNTNIDITINYSVYVKGRLNLEQNWDIKPSKGN
jgi:hypothetical protein